MQPKERKEPASKAQTVTAAPREANVTPLAGTHVARFDDEISVIDLWNTLRHYKAIVVLATLLGIAVPGIAGLMMTPQYRAEVLLAPVTDADDRSRLLGPLGDLGGIAALAGGSLQPGSRKNEAIALLKSRVLTEQFIKDENLGPVLFPDTWPVDGVQRQVDDAPTLSDAYELFDEKIRSVHEDRKAGLVILSVAWDDPQLAAQWANGLVARTNASMRQRHTEESQQAIKYLQEQLKQTSAVELQQVLHQLVESEMKEIILANVKEAFAFRVIDPAVAAEKPFKPVMSLMLAVGAILGCVAGVILALFVSFVRSQRASPGPG